MKIPDSNKITQIEVHQKIQSSKETVWNVISTAENLNLFHPFCKENKVILWDNENSKDSIEYYNGNTLVRFFTHWFEGEGYNLIIGKKNTAFAKVFWNITSTNQDNCTISIRIDLFSDLILSKYPSIFSGVISSLYLGPTMKKYLKSVVSGLKFYVEQNKVVQKNQFGTNRLFST